MKQLICKLHHEWGQNVFVGGKLIEIHKTEGTIDVDDEVAALLLQNQDKWADASVKTPFKKASSAPMPILSDKAGNVLSATETAAVLKAAEPEPAKAEEAAEWPTVDDMTPKADLLALCERLKAGGFLKSSEFSSTHRVPALLKAIEKGYKALSA